MTMMKVRTKRKIKNRCLEMSRGLRIHRNELWSLVSAEKANYVHAKIMLFFCNMYLNQKQSLYYRNGFRGPDALFITKY